ncbi:DNA-3-methyladenine glycosylase [Patulibacter sp.]|uniref:DNA-3-methyladenine glycosylase n=1 Tax=Patulibacter sp. TaxID=1912859 RepID=UPI002728B7EE|nr:DNA-3-methyladenine glycosylase [Patulibacter sp.]MDO9406870.1 DNA-3-methyladenine glycosylase [Patulibacter sp.]
MQDDGDPGEDRAAAAPLPVAFYDRPVVEVARDLLGCVVVHGATAGRIVETEAYHETEGACHAWRPPPAGPRRTARTAALFGPPGRAYVYRSYGIHAMLNAVCEPEGTAAAVLVRAVEPVAGVALMRERRPGRPDRELVAGPGRLTLALDVRLADDGTDLTSGDLRIVAAAPGARPVVEVAGPRIGITRATELPWRFADASSPDVSRPWPPGMTRGRRGR